MYWRSAAVSLRDLALKTGPSRAASVRKGLRNRTQTTRRASRTILRKLPVIADRMGPARTDKQVPWRQTAERAQR
ncbi:MAG: hypothetical protein ABI824_16705 [Acidobacteriota bacterium]